MAVGSSTGHSRVAHRSMTAAELMRLPEDGNRYELVRGELVAMAPAGFLHGVIVDRIGRRIGDYVEQYSLGVSAAAETGFQIERDADTVRAPDYAFVSHERLAGRNPASGYAKVTPDLVVEVVSPRDHQPDVGAKVAMWLDAGVRLVWVVDPASSTNRRPPRARNGFHLRRRRHAERRPGAARLHLPFGGHIRRVTRRQNQSLRT